MSLKNTARKTSRGGGKHPPPCGLGLKTKFKCLCQHLRITNGDRKEKSVCVLDINSYARNLQLFCILYGS